LLSLPSYRLTPALWLAISVLLYFAGSHPRQFLSRTRWAGALAWPPLRAAGELLYYVGVPYIALLRGDLLPSALGLAGLRWLSDIGLGIAFAGVSVALVTLTFRYAGGGTAAPAAAASPLWKAAALQIHWTFYRAALAQVIGDAYWGAFLSLLPIGLELALDPAWRRRLRADQAGPEAVRLTLLVTTTAQYILARNLALLIAAHWLTEVAATALALRRPHLNDP